MNPKLEQLRKRLASPSAPPDASGVYTLGPRSIIADYAEEQPTISNTNADMRGTVSEGPAPVVGIAEQNKMASRRSKDYSRRISLGMSRRCSSQRAATATAWRIRLKRFVLFAPRSTCLSNLPRHSKGCKIGS